MLNGGTVNTDGTQKYLRCQPSSVSRWCLLNKLNGCDTLHAVSDPAGGQKDFKDKYKDKRMKTLNKRWQVRLEETEQQIAESLSYAVDSKAVSEN